MLRVQDDQRPLAQSAPIDIQPRRLWAQPYPVIGIDHLTTRSEQAPTGVGWRDCGSDLQEFSSYTMCANVIDHAAGHGPADQLSPSCATSSSAAATTWPACKTKPNSSAFAAAPWSTKTATKT